MSQVSHRPEAFGLDLGLWAGQPVGAGIFAQVDRNSTIKLNCCTHLESKSPISVVFAFKSCAPAKYGNCLAYPGKSKVWEASKYLALSLLRAGIFCSFRCFPIVIIF